MTAEKDRLTENASKGAEAKTGPSERRIPVAGPDGVWLQDSAANLMVINAMYVMDRLSLDELRDLWQRRVLDCGGGERYPRFFRKVVRLRGRPFWERDSEFDIGRHVISVLETGIRSKGDLQRYLGRVAQQPLPGDRPRWQIQLVEEYEADRSAVIVRIHHCMGDGLALLPVLFSLMDDPLLAPDGSNARAKPVAVISKKKPSRFTTLVKAPLMGPFMVARKMAWWPDRTSLHGPKISGEKKIAWTERLDLADVKAIKTAVGGTVNDVLMASVAGAFGRYFEKHHGEVPARVRASMPVSVRSTTEAPEMNNMFAAVLLELPVGIRDARERLAEVKRRMDAMKRSTEPLVMYGTATALLKTLPQSWSRRVIDFVANKCTCVVTNVPGPQSLLSIEGRRLHSLMFWVPQRADIGIGISIFSFSGQVQLGVIADVSLMPEPTAFLQAFEEEFELLKQAVGV